MSKGEKRGKKNALKKKEKGKAPIFLFLCGEFYVKDKEKKGWKITQVPEKAK